MLGACSSAQNTTSPLTTYTTQVMYEAFNTKLFSQVQTYSLSELHIQRDKLLEQDIIIKAEIIAKSSNNTYIIVRDNGGRLLVKTTHLDDFNLQKGSSLSMLGKLKIDIAGQPYLTALAYKKIGKY